MATQQEFMDRIAQEFPDNSKLRVKPFRDFFADLVNVIYNIPGSSANDYENFRKLVFGLLGDPGLQEKLGSPSLLDFIMSGLKVNFINLPTGSTIWDYVQGRGTQDDYDKYFTVKPGEVTFFKFKTKNPHNPSYDGEEIYIFKGGTGNFGIKGTEDDPAREIQNVYDIDFFRINKESYITENLQAILMGDNSIDQYLQIMSNNNFENILDALVKLNLAGGKFSKTWTVQQPNNPNLANGLVVNKGDLIEDFLIKIFRKASPPVYNLPKAFIAPMSSTQEVGTTLYLNIRGSFNQNDGGPILEKRIFKNGSLFQNSDSATDTIVLPMPGSEINYSYQVHYAEGPVKNNSLGEPDPTNKILEGSTSSENISFKGLLLNFFGVAAPGITNYRDILNKNLSLKEFKYDTGTILKDHYIAIPSNNNLTKVWDANISTNITSYFGVPTIVMINDIGGTPREYKLYKYSAKTPYAVSHEFQITIS